MTEKIKQFENVNKKVLIFGVLYSIIKNDIVK